jgi:predicted AAA+ superfamily ATPase
MDAGCVTRPLTSGGEDMMVKTRGASQTRATLDGDTVEKPYELPKGLWARIAKKANELWEQSGCREGHDLEDWFDAETIVMEARREASHMSRIEQIQIVQLDKVSQVETQMNVCLKETIP